MSKERHYGCSSLFRLDKPDQQQLNHAYHFFPNKCCRDGRIRGCQFLRLRTHLDRVAVDRRIATSDPSILPNGMRNLLVTFDSSISVSVDSYILVSSESSFPGCSCRSLSPPSRRLQYGLSAGHFPRISRRLQRLPEPIVSILVTKAHSLVLLSGRLGIVNRQGRSREQP
jgi:hypothetical protein